MRVSVDLKPMCDCCPDFVLDATSDTLFADGNVFDRVTAVKCKNRELCDRIQRYVVKNQLTIPNVFDKSAYKQQWQVRSED